MAVQKHLPGLLHTVLMLIMALGMQQNLWPIIFQQSHAEDWQRVTDEEVDAADFVNPDSDSREPPDDETPRIDMQRQLKAVLLS